MYLRKLFQDIALLKKDSLWSLEQKYSLMYSYIANTILFKIARRRGYEKHLFRFLGKKVFSISPDNFLLIFREVFIQGHYSIPALSVERKNTLRILDAGANIGMTAIYFKAIFPNAHVIAFEPSPHTAKILKQNIEENKLRNVEVVEAALSASTGSIELQDDHSNPGRSTTTRSIYEAKSGNYTATTVNAVRLSKYVGECSDILKMDIEGGESVVLNELVESGALSRVRFIVFEFHLPPGKSTESFSEIETLLNNHEFCLERLHEDWIHPGNPVGGGHFIIRATNKLFL